MRALLSCWLGADVTLGAARAAWLACVGNKPGYVGSLTRPEDRDACCAYEVSGQLLDGDVGSVCAHAFPAGYAGRRALGECFLATIEPSELWARRAGGARDVVAAGVEHVREGVARIRATLASGALEVELRFAELRPGCAEVARVAALRPWTMSWSNVPDFFDRSDFHRLARACSRHGGTVHSAYSMSWPLFVKGASVLDMAHMGGVAAVAKTFDTALQAIGVADAELNAAPFMLSPPNEDVRNAVDWALHALPLPGMAQPLFHRWMAAFLADGCLTERHLGMKEPSLYNCFSRTNSTWYYTFTYDSTVTFKKNVSS